MAFHSRNDRYRPAEGQRPAPLKFPLRAPWPLMTFLAMDGQPLRVREDIWERWRDRGEFHGYGEYIGKIAQNVPMV
jgi:hypothetical protein